MLGDQVPVRGAHVRVEKHNDLATRRPHPRIARRRRAALRLFDDADREAAQEVGRTVRAAVVDRDDLQRQAGRQFLRAKRPHEPLDRAGDVQAGDDDGNDPRGHVDMPRGP